MSGASALSPDEAMGHLRALAREPRPAGGDAERRAREYCAAHLRANGFSVTEEPFVYSAFTGRYATPLLGMVSAAVLIVAATLGARGLAGVALAVLVGAIVAIAVCGIALGRSGVLSFPLARRSGVNLVAVRGDPSLWLVAHLDSKSQPVSIGLRAAGITASAMVSIVALGTAIVQLTRGTGVAMNGAGALPAQSASGVFALIWPLVGAAGVLASLPIAASVVGASSPGALDNASGVATMLMAASAVPAGRPLGVLIPSAEELALAGARAWVRGRRAGTAINCDGVDDVGLVRCMYTRAAPRRLIDAVQRAAGVLGCPMRAHRLIPGILTDGVALADAGWAVVTVSKGTFATLARIHTKRDSLDALCGTGVAEAARLVARVCTEL